MQWRAWAAIGVLVVGSGMTGCDCVGCTSKEVAREDGTGWSVSVTCEANTRIGGVGAGHAGGILYPNGCDVGWEVHVRGGNDALRAKVSGPSIDSRACGEVRAFCKKAKGAVITRAEGQDIVAVASTESSAVGFYILEPGQPFRWPAEGVASNEPAWKGAIAPAMAAGHAGDAPRLLAAMPATDALITEMLTDVLPLEQRMLTALEGPRLDRHLAEVRAAIGRCVIPSKTLERVTHAHVEALDDAYAAAFPRVLEQQGCVEATLFLRAEKPKAIAPRVVADLRACNARCPASRLENLAVLVDALEAKEAVPLLIPHLTAPRAEAWEKNDGETREHYLAWHAATYAVAHLDPAAARGPLLAQIASFSTRGFTDADDDDDDLDAGTRAEAGRDAGNQKTTSLPDGVDEYDFPLTRSLAAALGGGSWRVTLRDLFELLLVADDASVHDSVFALASDPKRDRGVRQMAVAYLDAVHDSRAEALVADEKILTAKQRTKLRPPPPAPGSASPSTPTPSRSRSRHHHH